MVNNVNMMDNLTSANKKHLIVAIDHGLSFGDMPGLERPFSLLDIISKEERVDGLIASAGIYRQAERRNVSLEHKMRFITVDYVVMGSSPQGDVLMDRVIVLTSDEAAAYRPHGYKMFLNIYGDRDLLISNIKDFSAFAQAGRRLGIAALAEVLFYNNAAFKDPARQASELLRGCRLAMELGADMLKIPNIGNYEAIGEVIDRLGLPTYILGGGSDNASYIEDVIQVSKLPISGLMVGRNIWQGADVVQRICEVSVAMGRIDASANSVSRR